MTDSKLQQYNTMNGCQFYICSMLYSFVELKGKIMQLTGPAKVIFPDGNGQQPCPISATGNVGTVAYTVTAVPSQVVSVRKTSGSTPLVVGSALTAAEAAALVVTRATSGGLGPMIAKTAITSIRSRVYATGATAPAFVVASASDMTAFQGGNFWLPNFPTGGTGTLTVEILFDTGTAITLGRIADIFMQLGYASATSSSWGGVVAKAIISANGTALTLLNTLSGIADSGNPNSQQHYSGSVTGATSARWFGIQLTLVPISYPFILFDASVNATSGGTYTNLPTPVFFSVQGNDTGAGGVTVNRSSVTGFRRRAFSTGGTIPAFTVGSAADISAIQGGNFWIPNFPANTSGTATVELLFDTGTAITLGNIADLFMQLNYSTVTSSSWSGAVVKAITSTDGVAVTVLNTLTGVADTGNPNSQQHFSGNVTGASSARWFGVQLTLLPNTYPLILFNVSVKTVGASTASITVPIGDTTTNFGNSSIISITGGPIIRLGSTETSKPLGLSVSGGTAPYSITLNAQGMVAPVSVVKVAGGAAITGTATAVTLAEFQALRANRTTHTAYLPGTPIDYSQTVSIRSESNGSTTLLDSRLLAAFINRNFFGIGGGSGLTSSGFLAEMPSAAAIGTITNMPLRYGFGETVPTGTTVEFLTSANGTTLTVASTIPLPVKGTDGNYTISATISGAASAKFWGLRFKFAATTTSSGVGFYNGVTPLLATPSTPYQDPDNITAASTLIVTIADSVGNSANATLRIGATDTVVVEAPGATEPAFAELQELVGSTWTSRGTLVLTGRIADIAPDSGMRFETTTGAVWVTDPASALPIMGTYEAWGIRFGWGSAASRKYSYCFGLKPTATAWSTYPFGDVTQNARQTVPGQKHRWVVKTSSAAVVEVLDWNGTPINDPAKSPKQFWAGDAAGNLTTPGYRPFHIGQAVCGWTTAPNVRSTVQGIFPKVDAGLEWTFRDPGVTNPQDYTMTAFQINGLFNIYAMEAEGVATGQFNWTSEDPEMVTTSSRHISSTMYGYVYHPGQTSGRDVTTGPGGTRSADRCIVGDAFARVLQSPSAIRPHRNVAWKTIALEMAKSQMSENCFHITNPRLPKPVTMTTPGGAPSFGRWYYGTGDISDPQTIDLNSGRADAINGDNDIPARPGKYALSKTDPSGWLYWTGQIADAEHNYPFAAIGALLFESPTHWWAAQFHFLQSSMVLDRTGFLTSFPGSWMLRPNAWPWANAAYIWAIQDSAHPLAVITRTALEARLKADLIRIADQEIPYINADPANLDSVEDYNRALMKRFGGLGSSFTKSPGPTLIAAGYLCQGLQLWKKFGLWDRMRSLDPRCAVALDFVLNQIGKLTVDLLLDAPYMLTLQAGPGATLPNFQPTPWPSQDPPVGTSPSALVQTWAAWAAANPANGATFWQNTSGQYIYGIGQFHLLHCVTALRRVFGSTYPRIDAAETSARQLMSTRIAAIRALPVGQRSGHLSSMEVYQNLISSTETGATTTF